MTFQRTQVSIALEDMRLKYVRIPGTFNINLNLQDIWTRQVYHAMPLWRAECWDSTTYFSKVSPTSNCFSRNNLQMLTWARRLETGVVQSLHDCQFLEEASIVLSRGGVLKITLATWHVTRDTWLRPCAAQHSRAAARVPQVPGPCRLSLQGWAGGILHANN